MPEGPLRKSIEELTIKVGIPVKDIVYVDGSKRHENANAFMIGSGENKKIVLYDNLISKDGLNLTNDEILAILAHEIHHYKMNHSIKILTSQVFSLGIFLFILSFTIYNEYFYNSFGFTEIDVSLQNSIPLSYRFFSAKCWIMLILISFSTTGKFCHGNSQSYSKKIRIFQ